MPFSWGVFRTALDPFVLLGFLGSAFVGKVRGWPEREGELDDDVARTLTADDSPLKGLVSNGQSSSSGSDVLPPDWGWVEHQEGKW